MKCDDIHCTVDWHTETQQQKLCDDSRTDKAHNAIQLREKKRLQKRALRHGHDGHSALCACNVCTSMFTHLKIFSNTLAGLSAYHVISFNIIDFSTPTLLAVSFCGCECLKSEKCALHNSISFRGRRCCRRRRRSSSNRTLSQPEIYLCARSGGNRRHAAPERQKDRDR